MKDGREVSKREASNRARVGRRTTSVRWSAAVDARLRILVNLAPRDAGRQASASEILAGLVISAPLAADVAARAVVAARTADESVLALENADHPRGSSPRLGRPRSARGD